MVPLAHASPQPTAVMVESRHTTVAHSCTAHQRERPTATDHRRQAYRNTGPTSQRATWGNGQCKGSGVRTTVVRVGGPKDLASFTKLAFFCGFTQLSLRGTLLVRRR